MWFRNLLVYRLTKAFPVDAEALEVALKEKAARVPGTQELSTVGFIAPLGKGPDAPLVHTVNGLFLIGIRKSERILPGVVVSDAVSEKVEEIETRDGRKVYKKERDQIKDEIVQQLLPHAFIRKSATFAAIDPANQLVYVNCASPAQAEALLSTLREGIGTLPIRPLSVKIAPAATFTEWVKTEKAAPDFYVLSDCEMRDTEEDGGSIALKQQDLTSDEVKNLLASGKVVTQMGLAWQDKMSFVINDKLQFRKLRFDDLIQDQAVADGGDDAAGQFSASFFLMMSTLAGMLPALLTSLGGEDVPAGI
ncbi:recombination-associated protein RdgC [Stutzerimonas xanthomarina]|jgi:recombination associated protein RdgC|uniref:Recombination-associated protein RdgC n=1 Tax=Stutzerimonas xanthomarina TaxID=271420 RepID=A0A427DPJ8_9GAMM|nr:MULTISPECIES: recombination-associated protein RdgC [Stutzerimonas]KIL03108.1 recombinase RdgC [Stutzerimonas stutzeri]RRV05480.1 recombination-associated protein RdgC [Stutzerimonas xanthomarina]